jgi:uncharacterized protein (TIGR02117 family)
VSVFVVRHAWHTGIVLRRQDIPADLWPERDDFPGVEHLEIGWGDRQFYQARDPSPGMALRAAIFPGPSVLHVAGFSGPVTRFFAGAEVLEARLALPDFGRLCAFIGGAHARDPSGRSIPLGAGLYGASRFYAGRERYSVLTTCNMWTARALRAAGLPVVPARAFTAGSVMRQLRAIGLGPPAEP